MADSISENEVILTNINSISADILKMWRKVYKLVEAGTPQDINIAGTNMKIADYNNRIVAVLSYSSLIKPGKDVNFSLISKSSLINGLTSLESAKSQIESIQNSIDSLVSQDQAISRIDPSNGYLYTVSGSPTNIQPYLVGLLSQLDTFMQHISIIVPFMKMYSSFNLSRMTSDYFDAKVELENLIADFQTLEQKISKIYDNQENVSTRLKDNFEDSQVKLDAINSSLSLAIEHTDKIIASQEDSTKSLENVLENYDNIRKMVESFKEFDDGLNGRINSFTEFTEFYDEMQKNNIRYEAKIDENLERTDNLLKGATVAAIASAYSEAYADYKKRANKAVIGYYVSILLLVVCIIPLAIYIYPGQLAGWLSFFKGNQVEISGVIARAIIVLPALFLITFAGKRYGQLFDLEREYSHRTTLAKSVNAFKMEAPTHSELITAAVFIELQRNPLDRLNGQEEEKVTLKDGQLKELIDTITETVSKIWPSK